MNIQEFEATVKQSLGLEGTAEEKSSTGIVWFELIQKDEATTVEVTYYLCGKCEWTFEITRKLDEDEVKVSKNNRWVYSPNLEEGECLVVRLYGEGETLAKAVNDALF